MWNGLQACLAWARARRWVWAGGMLIAAVAVLAHRAVVPGAPDLLTLVTRSASVATLAAGDPSVVPDQAIVSLASELPAHDPTVGRVEGSGATSGGAASYTIPIVVPPGRRGMQPELALGYSSSGGNGIAGMGWSLSGLSAITRCPFTLDQDGSVAAVGLSASDRLCLDGQRLVLTAGTYGQSGATYTTELASFSRVTQLGGALNSATVFFKVEAKDGSIYYYGGTSTAASASRVIPGNTTLPLSWLVERKQDRVGNLMRYAYTSIGSGETVLSSILYTGFGATDGNRHVDFTYEVRPSTSGANDISSSYTAGALTLQTRRLKQITTYVGSQAVRWYVLRYDGVSSYSGRTLLRGIKDCSYRTDGTTVACHPETTFTWQEGTLDSELHKFSATGLPTDKGQISSMTPVGDIDGDGVQELSVHYIDNTHQTPGWDYLLSLNADRTPRGVIDEATLGISPSLHPVDFNKDGRSDSVGFTSDGIGVTLWNGSTTAFTSAAFSSYTLSLGLAGVCYASNINGYEPVIADFNGDGFMDLAVATPVSGTCAKAPGNSAWNLKVFLGKAGATPGTPSLNATPAIVRQLPYVTQSDGAKLNFYPTAATDFDGDGLADIVLTRQDKDAVGGVRQDLLRSQALWFSRSAGGVFSVGGTGKQLDSYAAMASPALEPDETHIDAFTRSADLNGDGLEDLISIKISNGVGYWSVRYNVGGRWGSRIVTTNRRGIEFCKVSTTAGSTCNDRWVPMFAPLLSIVDTDNDGRAEIFAPRAFAMRICAQNTTWGISEPRDDYYCPENPLTGTVAATTPDPSEHMHGWYGNSGGQYPNPLTVDGSAYYMDSVRFIQTGASAVSALTVNTPIIASGATRSYPQRTLFSYDMFGDGLGDYLGPIGAPVAPDKVGSYPYYSTYAFVSSDPTWGPASLPDGTPASSFSNHWYFYIAETPGASSTPNPDGATPQVPDMLAMVTDGLGVKTGWTYYPLSSDAGRPAGDLPLYTVPADIASRYVDDRHFYFASSMQVVSDMFQSDGLSDDLQNQTFRSWRYGYSEAMYQTHGRGFQGFRTITEEDDAAGVRTTTVFEQKFPLTGRVYQLKRSSLNRSYTDPNGIFFQQNSYWRCNRANRADTAACAPPNGTATVVFPFLDEQQNYTYDPATASAPSGTPALLSFKRFFAADDTTCAGSIPVTSGYDANGNLLASVWLTYDGPSSGDGAGGTRKFLGVHCQRTRSVYAAADTTNWWLDKLNSRSVTSAVTYNTNVHPLPAGVANPSQTVTTTYGWNADRTPASENVQPGVAGQDKLVTYGYPTPSYGLPSSVTVRASGDTNGTRTTSTTYSADGYFPLTVTNAVGHNVTTVTRPEDGQPSQVTDANGLRTLLQYDAFGFNSLTQFRGATDDVYVAPDKKAGLRWCSPTFCFAKGRFRLTVVQDGHPTNVVDSDMLGREVGNAHRLQDVTWSDVAKQYDQAGHMTSESEPYRPGNPVYWTLYSGFDVVGRPTKKVVPKANQDGRGDLVTTYTYSGRTTAIKVCGSADVDSTRCLNLSRTTDSLGHYVETVDAANGATKFWYDGNGNTLAIRDAKGSVLSATYNPIGQRLSSSDPNLGAWQFAYDALGELTSQMDARGITTTTSYDKLGRPLQRSAAYDYDGSGGTETVTDRWTYDPAYGKGAEASNTRSVTFADSTVRTIRSEASTYDTLARPASRTITQLRSDNINTDTLTQETAYDSYYGWPKARTYGNAEVVWLRYSRYGDLFRQSNGLDGADYSIINNVDDRGQPIKETWSAATITVVRATSPKTGQVLSIDYTGAGGASLRSFDYAYDVFGNLGQEDLNNGATREVYDYDNLHRLTEATRTGGATGTVDYTYDAVGNLTSKSDFSTAVAGAYSYVSGTCGGGPNAVKSVALAAGGSRTYCYDANGNMTSDNAGMTSRYDHTQRPLQINKAGSVQFFDYSPAGERVREWGTDGEVAFYGTLERRYTPAANDKLYVGSNTLITQSGSSRVVTYMLTDRLGSVDAIANSAGNLIETRGFDAFGKPRTGTWADATPPRLTSTATTRHGFTGHEHLDSLQLIHMNGRVYDYNLGRFMEVDPVVQFPMNSQSLNPYSYLLNNPLSGTDPTGYMLCSAPRWVCFYLDQQDQPRGPPMLIHADSPGWSVGEGGGNGATTKKRKSSSTPDEIGSAQKREPSNTSGDDIAGINANAKQSGKPIYGDPDPETIRDSVVKNANLAPYVTVDPKTGALSARIPYVVEQGTDPALQSAFEAEVESRLSGTFTKGVLRWKKTITIQVDLVQSATGVFTLGTCTSTCASPAIQGATIGDINKPANRIEIAPMARSGTRVHEFLHLSGLGHQWNSTNSIMSYSADRRVLFSDVERFYDAYRH